MASRCESFLCRGPQKEQTLWDSFQDPPPPQSSGSAMDTKRFETFKKCLKLFAYIFVFLVVLGAGIASKLSYLFVTAHIKDGVKVKYCDIERMCDNRFGGIVRMEDCRCF